jgi:hypothetical protein
MYEILHVVMESGDITPSEKKPSYSEQTLSNCHFVLYNRDSVYCEVRLAPLNQADDISCLKDKAQSSEKYYSYIPLLGVYNHVIYININFVQ